MLELIAQENFGKLNNFPDNFRIKSVQKDKDLKKYFYNLSKTGTKFGIPDAVYKFENTLIIVEIKSDDLKKAVLDIKHYYNGLKNNNFQGNIICIGFIGDGSFKVFENEKEIFPDSLKMEDINLKLHNKIINENVKKNLINYNKEQMDKKFYKIHNFIRDNCHISSREKIILVLGILTALKDNLFVEEWNKYYDNSLLNQFLFDRIKQIYSEKLNKNDTDERIKNFLFVKTHESFKNSNNLHEIIKLVVEIKNLNYKGDLINLFYSEFVKYSDSDGQALGIVLTPEYIVELMVYMLNINKNDIILDICTGTGSFILECLKYNPKHVIGCEMQNDLFLMAESNFILRDAQNYELKKGNCFNYTFEVSKSISNPPFGQKKIGEKELNFYIKQIESTKNGLSVCIFPQSCISNNKQNNLIKKKIMEMATIKCVITLNNTVFYPNANIGCSIILVDTSKPHDYEKDETLFIDFTNDEYEIEKHNGRNKTKNFQKKFDNIKKIITENKQSDISLLYKITETSEWNYFSFYKNKTKIINLNELKLKKLDMDYEIQKLELLQKKEINLKNTKMFKICDIFNIETVKKPLILNKIKKNIGNVPYIGASKLNNGITCRTIKYKNAFLNEPYCITLATNGSVGISFYQNVHFYASSDIYILRFKNEYLKYKENIYVNLYFCMILEKLSFKYNFCRKLKMNKLIGENAEEIELPINENYEIDFQLIQSLFN